jgi:prevent-host-death family protein
MDKTVPAAEANRIFSRLLDAVAHGTSFIITSHGKPVARLAPPPAGSDEAAKQRLLDRSRSQPVQDFGPWTRDELYD